MRALGGIAAALMVVAGCENSQVNAPTGPAVRFSLAATGLPPPLDVPWPSDLYKSDADGTIADGLSWSALKYDAAGDALEAWGALDGFGRHAGALFALDGLGMTDEVDPATLDCGTSVRLLALDTGTELPCIAGLDPYTATIVVVPRDTLAAGQRHAAIVTTAVKLLDGRALGASAAFARIRDQKARSSATEQLYGHAVDDALAADATLARDHIAGLAVFTTQTMHTRLRKLRDALDAGTYGAAPVLITSNVAAPYLATRFGATAHTGWTATLDEWLGTPLKSSTGADLPGVVTPRDLPTTGFAHDALGAVLNATFVSPEMRRPFTSTASRDDGTIAFDANGDATAVKLDQQIPVTIMLPKGPAPVGGFPVVILQHTLGSSRTDALAIGNELARAGIATAAIDAPLHGMRSALSGDTSSNGRGSYAGPDGFADGPGQPNPIVALNMVSGLKNFLATRDNFWQATLDLVQLRRLIAGCDLSFVADEYGGTAPKLDATHVGYIGMSMGGILGTLLAGVEPKSAIDPFVLDVPGAGLMRAFTEGPNFAVQVGLLTSLAGLPTEALDAHLFSAYINLGQGIFDSADAGSFAADAAAAHNIWMMGAMYDEVIPRLVSDTLARALGATQLTPTLRPIDGLTQGSMVLTPDGSGRLVGYFELAPATHPHLIIRTGPINYEPPVPRDSDPRFPKLPQPIILREPILGAQRALVDFLGSTWAGAPKIAVDSPLYLGLLPVADIDDDGYCDDDERAAGSDPFDHGSVPSSGTPNCVRDVGF